MAHEAYMLARILTSRSQNLAAEKIYLQAVQFWLNSKNDSSVTISRMTHHAELPEIPPAEEFTFAVARLGDASLALNDIDAAIKYYSKAAQYFKPSDDITDGASSLASERDSNRINQAIAFDRLGQALLLKGDSTAALESYAKAVSVMSEIKSNKNSMLGTVTRDYANALWSSGKYFDALSQKYKAMDIFANSR